MKQKRTYIAGPMRGHPKMNSPAFYQADAWLKSMGWDTINPAKLDEDSGFDPEHHPATKATVRAAARRDVDALFRVDAITLLPGWENSTGAQAELALARWLGLEVYLYPSMVRQFPEGHKPPIIAFCGAARTGKSTGSRILLQCFSESIRIAFAKPLRDMLEAIGVSDLYHTHKKEEPIPFLPGAPTARHLLQTLGTEWGRNCVHPEIWTHIAMKRACELRDQGKMVVIDDLRFVNEAAAVSHHGGKIIKITHPEAGKNPSHQSEMEWGHIQEDFCVENTGTLEEFRDALLNTIDQIRNEL